MQVTAYVALGTNLGSLRENLDGALQRLREKGLQITKVSSYIDTDPYGVTDQPRFLNAVCEVQTELLPRQLLEMLLQTELEMGRVRLRRWGERIIDLDLLFYGSEIINEPDLTVPHPDMQNRDFVLRPLAEIAPGKVHPLLHKTIGQLWQEYLEKKDKMKYELNAERLVKRFTAYAKINTASDERSAQLPSSKGQWQLAEHLKNELTELGLANVQVTDKCYVLAELPANTEEAAPVIGLIAHMDTSSEASGENVQVTLHKAWDGSDMQLAPGCVLSVKEFPEMAAYRGQDILTAGGTTLLGADDKAGITAIVSACEYLLQHLEIKHGKVLLAFTPDEEIGRGTDGFPLADFKADFAYTVDGGALGELNYETFNACNAKIVFNGVSVHPGSAKNKMRNAVTMAAEWQLALPQGEKPEYTDGYEGFYHCLRIEGGTDRVELDMILRDHDKNILAKRKQLLLDLAAFMNNKYGAGSVECSLQDMYCNMKEYITPVFEIVERAENAMREAGIEPQLVPVRGGTDGSRLSEMGLPCPNIFTGGHNFHGRYEYLPVPSLVKCTEVLLNIVKL